MIERKTIYKGIVILGDEDLEKSTALMCVIAMAGMIHELNIPEFTVRKELGSGKVDMYYSPFAEEIIKRRRSDIEDALMRRLDPLVVRKLMITLLGYEYYT